jgi:uncharacterized glyoxalase superfamily protein PhnB
MGSDRIRAPEQYVTSSQYLYVKDCDTVFDRAKSLGCEVLMPLNDTFWGNRTGELRDPYAKRARCTRPFF